MPHNSQHSIKNRRAVERLSALRAAGVPATLSPREAWYLSGGVMGRQDGYQPARAAYPAAMVAKRVADCLAFLPDYLEEFPVS